MKIEINMNSDTADLLIVENLKQTLADMKNDLELRKKGVGISIFSSDQKKDIAEIKQHIKAFKICLNYFGGSNEGYI
jgi:hypothetical protein